MHSLLDTNKLVDDYMLKRDWRVKENSNAPFNFGSMNKYITGNVSKRYWCERVYDKEAMKAHDNGMFHIHDLSGLTLYCCGYSLQKVQDEGIHGISNIPTSAPAKHFDAMLNQLANITTIFQNEIMGAVAFSSFDTLLAPYVKNDGLTYREVKQSMQNFIYSINSNSRAGAEPAFSNLTFDLVPPHDLANMPAKIAGQYQEYTYSECTEEMDMINKAFWEIMLDGDAEGDPFAYPIPTYSIQKDFEWDNPKYDLLWEMTGKYGYPYFSNYINSDMDPSDVRSMCCRLRLDLTELSKRNGGLFGSGDSTGSIGVVTLNLPRMGYLCNTEEELLGMIYDYMCIAKESLEDKRNWLNMHIVGTGMIPAFDTYVGTLDNHFSTIGLVGLNEMCQNLIGEGITTENGKNLALTVLDYMRNVLLEFQVATGHLYNLEATPAESTCYRLAKLDKEKYPDIFTQGTGNEVYYTNSCHLPVSQVESIKQLLDHQNELQAKFTGGTVVHIYAEEGISGSQVKKLIKTACTNYVIPYISWSPIIRTCPTHGTITGVHNACPFCGSKLKLHQRITGYIREITNYNPGKHGEFVDRKQIKAVNAIVNNL